MDSPWVPPQLSVDSQSDDDDDGDDDDDRSTDIEDEFETVSGVDGVLSVVSSRSRHSYICS